MNILRENKNDLRSTNFKVLSQIKGNSTYDYDPLGVVVMIICNGRQNLAMPLHSSL
jgi:hypothetical protein